MEAQKASTDADSHDDYLDDVVVRAAMKRLEREFADNDSVSVYCERFDTGFKTDYISVSVESNERGYELADVVQSAVDTGVVKVTKIQARAAKFAPTEN